MVALLAPCTLIGQTSILGLWQNWDDETGEPKAHIEIYESSGKIRGKVIKLLPTADITHCNSCKGSQKGKPLVGMDILWDLEKENDYYTDGEILDPASGKVYSLNITRKGDELDVRGYLGVSLFGRSQKWTLVKE